MRLELRRKSFQCFSGQHALGQSNNYQTLGCRHSSADSSAPTILLPQVRVPNTPCTLFITYCRICAKFVNKKNNLRPDLAHLKKYYWLLPSTKTMFIDVPMKLEMLASLKRPRFLGRYVNFLCSIDILFFVRMKL